MFSIYNTKTEFQTNVFRWLQRMVHVQFNFNALDSQSTTNMKTFCGKLQSIVELNYTTYNKNYKHIMSLKVTQNEWVRANFDFLTHINASLSLARGRGGYDDINLPRATRAGFSKCTERFVGSAVIQGSLITWKEGKGRNFKQYSQKLPEEE